LSRGVSRPARHRAFLRPHRRSGPADRRPAPGRPRDRHQLFAPRVCQGEDLSRRPFMGHGAGPAACQGAPGDGRRPDLCGTGRVLQRAAAPGIAFDLAEAKRRGETDTLEELRKLGEPPYETVDKANALERVTTRYGGVDFEPRNRTAIVVHGVLL